jgi:recombinational DNA repair ATPase RecF
MSQLKTGKLTVEVDISNIGGIDQSSTTLRPGVNVLTGKNATNRTSYLQAIVAACGSENVSLKADADQGDVSLTIGDQEYTRTLKRQNGTLFFDGDPYLDDPILGDLFAFLK